MNAPRLRRFLVILPIAGLFVAAGCTTFPGRSVGRAVRYATFEEPGPNIVHVIRAERDDDEPDFIIGWPQMVRNFATRETTSVIAGQYAHEPDTNVVAAVNASFFGNVPNVIGLTISDGEPLEMPGGQYETVVIDDDGRPFVLEDVSHQPGTLGLADGGTLEIAQFNRAPHADAITLYTPAWGPLRADEPAGDATAVILGKLTGPVRYGATVEGDVMELRSGVDMDVLAVPKDGVVLLAHGTQDAAVRAGVKPGDTVRLRLPGADPKLAGAEFAVTGIGWLVHEGAAHEANWEQYKFAPQRHPRTVFAWNEKAWFLMVVDGRREGSVGMTFAEMADFLIDKLNVWEAVNLDGGGSATMVVGGQVQNVPSDGRERPVANAVLLVR